MTRLAFLSAAHLINIQVIRTFKKFQINMNPLISVFLIYLYASSCKTQELLHCSLIFNSSDFPCQCSLGFNSTLSMNCDNIIMKDSLITYSFHPSISKFSQRNVGYQTLNSNLFIFGTENVKVLDFSDNQIQRIPEKTFYGLRDSLEELKLSHNALGDQLNPIFSTNELQYLHELRILDLSYNQLLRLDSHIFQHLIKLEELHLEWNLFDVFPKDAIQPLESLLKFHFQGNLLTILHPHSFQSLKKLDYLNLGENLISKIHNQSFNGLDNLSVLLLNSNQLDDISSGAFDGLTNLTVLDLSNNYLINIPSEELKKMVALNRLFLGSNRLRHVHSKAFANIPNLEFLDLSRNRLVNLQSGAFYSLKNLHELYLDFNLLRKFEDRIFEDIIHLEILTLDDNMLLNVPTQALNKLNNLHVLSLNYNRITIMTSDILQNLTSLEELSLQYNTIREILPGTFTKFTKLQMLDLHGNFLTTFSGEIIQGINEQLLYLDVGNNQIAELEDLSLPKLQTLILSNNNLNKIKDDFLEQLPQLINLHLDHNSLTQLPSKHSFSFLWELENLYLQNNELQIIPSDFFSNMKLIAIDLSNNKLQYIHERTFYNLSQLISINLSYNKISNISKNAFQSLPILKALNLSHNHLSTIRDNYFDSYSNLQVLDLGYNDILFIYPNSFTRHSNLINLHLNNNKLFSFSSEIINVLHHLSLLDLHSNNLQSISNEEFREMPQLRYLDLSNNSLHTIAENAFQNSTQMQYLNLSKNNIKTLPTKLFMGMQHLNLDISKNKLNSLPEDIFNQQYVANLDSINLSSNLFLEIPLKSLQKQTSSLISLDLSRNYIANIPIGDNTLINIQQLDFSFNQLQLQSVNSIFKEPKVVRNLNLAAMGIVQVLPLETPFLQKLNLSHNMIKNFPENIFQRATRIKLIDLSYNFVSNINTELSASFKSLTNLKHLDLSHNPILQLNAGDFAPIDKIITLHLNNLSKLLRFEEDVFHGLKHLQHLEITNFPQIPYLNVKNVLVGLPFLHSLQIEVKDSDLREQLHSIFSARLKSLGITGKNLLNIESQAFAGITNPDITIDIKNTSIESLYPSMFLSLPMSSRIKLLVSNNNIDILSPQFLNFLEEHKGNIKLKGLNKNPLNCDCNMKPMKRWLTNKTKNYLDDSLICSYPEHMKGKIIEETNEGDFSCFVETSTLSTTLFTTFIEEISTVLSDSIFEPTPALENLPEQSENKLKYGMNNMDSMIIGTIVGVVGFVCIIIVIICVVKLRQVQQHQQQWRNDANLAPDPNQCTCIKSKQPFCQCMPNYSPQIPNPNSSSKMFPPNQHMNYFPNPPYYVTYPESDHDHR